MVAYHTVVGTDALGTVNRFSLNTLDRKCHYTRVCVYVCVLWMVRATIRVGVCMCVCAGWYIYQNMCLYISKNVFIYIWAVMPSALWILFFPAHSASYVPLCVCVHVCVCAFARVYRRMYAYIYMYICTYNIYMIHLLYISMYIHLYACLYECMFIHAKV